MTFLWTGWTKWTKWTIAIKKPPGDSGTSTNTPLFSKRGGVRGGEKLLFTGKEVFPFPPMPSSPYREKERLFSVRAGSESRILTFDGVGDADNFDCFFEFDREFDAFADSLVEVFVDIADGCAV